MEKCYKHVALDFLAVREITHRGIKLANILYNLPQEGGDSYCFQLGDFGLCSRLADAKTTVVEETLNVLHYTSKPHVIHDKALRSLSYGSSCSQYIAERCAPIIWTFQLSDQATKSNERSMVEGESRTSWHGRTYELRKPSGSRPG